MNQYLIIIENNLVNIFGESIQSNNGSKWGFELSPEFQKFNKILGKMISVFKVTNKELAQLVANEQDSVQLVTELEANQFIDDFFEDEYAVKNESLMNVNISKAVERGQINIEEMNPEWTTQQELEYLWKQGVSGIERKTPKYLNDTYISQRPEVKPEIQYIKLYSHLNFIELFTQADQERYLNYKNTINNNSNLTDEQKIQIIAKVEIAVKKFEMAGFINLEDPRLRVFLNELKAIGILVDADIDAILTPKVAWWSKVFPSK